MEQQLTVCALRPSDSRWHLIGPFARSIPVAGEIRTKKTKILTLKDLAFQWGSHTINALCEQVCVEYIWRYYVWWKGKAGKGNGVGSGRGCHTLFRVDLEGWCGKTAWRRGTSEGGGGHYARGKGQRASENSRGAPDPRGFCFLFFPRLVLEQSSSGNYRWKPCPEALKDHRSLKSSLHLSKWDYYWRFCSLTG